MSLFKWSETEFEEEPTKCDCCGAELEAVWISESLINPRRGYMGCANCKEPCDVPPPDWGDEADYRRDVEGIR